MRWTRLSLRKLDKAIQYLDLSCSPSTKMTIRVNRGRPSATVGAGGLLQKGFRDVRQDLSKGSLRLEVGSEIALSPKEKVSIDDRYEHRSSSAATANNSWRRSELFRSRDAANVLTGNHLGRK